MNRELFYEVVLFTESNGYKGHLDMLPVMPLCETSATLLAKNIFWHERRYEIIFNHKFAKAFFGVKRFGNKEVINVGWKIHLERMVIAKDPFEYLEKEYERIKTC